MAAVGKFLIERPEETLRDRVIDGIRHAIVTGVLRPGERLTERQLIELTGVSRTLVREALTYLHAIRLVESSPSRGLRVPTLDRATVQEIFEVRASLEPAVARLFVERATEEEVADVVSLFSDRTGEGDLNQRLEGIYRMDQLLISGARNSVLAEILDPLRARIQALRRVSISMPGRVDAATVEIQRICDAIERRDALEAEKASRDHIRAAGEVALLALELLDTDNAASEDNGSNTN